LDLPFEYGRSALHAGFTEEDLSTDPDGLHYLWWEANIITPLIAASKPRRFSSEAIVAPKIQKLLQVMEELGKNPLGFAVQLWVVESVGIDMILFLLVSFAKIEVDGEKLFKSSEVMNWVAAHIEDDSITDQRICYGDHKTIPILETMMDQNDLFILAAEYTHCWKDALDELYGLLYRETLIDDRSKVACHLL